LAATRQPQVENPQAVPGGWTEWLTLAGFCAFLFFFGLGAFGLVGADEPRYAEVAREMLRRHDWVTPCLYGQPWLEKPVLYYWQAMISFAVFGVKDWAARLPSAVDATALVVAVYLFFRRFRPGFQLDAALLTATTAGMVGLSRSASTDMALSAMFAIALIAWLGWYEGGRRRWLLAFYFFLAQAALAKGPVAIVLAAAVILIFAITRRDWRLIPQTLWWPGLVLFFAAALPWYIAVQIANPEFFHAFIVEQNFARFSTDLYHHLRPWWYFIPVLLLAVVPWTVLAIGSVSRMVGRWCGKGTNDQDGAAPAASFLVIWTAVVLVFFSFSRSKLPAYILPAVPACALLAADELRRSIAAAARPRSAWLVLHAGMAAGLVGPSLLVQYLVLDSPPGGAMQALAAGLSTAFFLGILMTLLRRGWGALRFVTMVPVIVAVTLIVRWGGPALDVTQSARPVARALDAMETTRLPLAVFDVTRYTIYGLAFYRDQPIANYNSGQIPPGEHLLVAGEGSQPRLQSLLGGRRLAHLGGLQSERLEYFWVSAAGSSMHHHP
jgi:4-amino-4-deoxy-L-arabinose transferase-like glycosyltransferase